MLYGEKLHKALVEKGLRSVSSLMRPVVVLTPGQARSIESFPPLVGIDVAMDPNLVRDLSPAMPTT